MAEFYPNNPHGASTCRDRAIASYRRAHHNP